jgi:tRNA(fMet)-specific endonuclease VapC
VIEFDNEAAQAYGSIRAHLERIGTPIGSNDILIAGHARSRNMTLVTNNVREFDRVPGLKVENWVA